jgi:hypothetical protein
MYMSKTQYGLIIPEFGRPKQIEKALCVKNGETGSVSVKWTIIRCPTSKPCEVSSWVALRSYLARLKWATGCDVPFCVYKERMEEKGSAADPFLAAVVRSTSTSTPV